jgi:Flp pilus assembly CpaF family ATPase
MSFKDLILDSEKDKDKNINILSDDVAFHGSTFSIRDFENSTGNVDLTHISGMISQINPYEYIINVL